MQYTMQELSAEIAKITLDGRFDIEAAQAVDLKMMCVAGARKLVLIDMAKVTFLGSMGLRTLFTMVRVLHARGGKLALLSPETEVGKVLAMSGITALATVYSNEEAVFAELKN